MKNIVILKYKKIYIFKQNSERVELFKTMNFLLLVKINKNTIFERIDTLSNTKSKR